jgi:hypothetical protein
MLHRAVGASALLALRKSTIAAICWDDRRGRIERWAATFPSEGITGHHRVALTGAHFAASFAKRFDLYALVWLACIRIYLRALACRIRRVTKLRWCRRPWRKRIWTIPRRVTGRLANVIDHSWLCLLAAMIMQRPQLKCFAVTIEVGSQWGSAGRHMCQSNASVAITSWHVRVLNQDGENLSERRTCS